MQTTKFILLHIICAVTWKTQIQAPTQTTARTHCEVPLPIILCDSASSVQYIAASLGYRVLSSRSNQALSFCTSQGQDEGFSES